MPTIPKKQLEPSFKKNFLWNSVGSTLYALTSLAFLVIVTRINGVDSAGDFTFAFSFVCLAQAIGTYAGRTYQVTERDDRICDTDYLYFRVLNCAVMIACAILFICSKNYSHAKILILLLLLAYRTLDSMSEAFFGIFQKNCNLFQVGISLTLRSGITVAAFLLVDIVSHNLILAIVSLLLSDFLIFIFYDIIRLRKYNITRRQFRWNNLLILARGGLPVFLFTLVSQAIPNAPKFAIDDMLSKSEQAYFGIILMPATLMILCSQLIVHPCVVKLTHCLQSSRYRDFLRLTVSICAAVFIFGLLAALICALVGIPFLNFIYSIDVAAYFTPLMIIIAGSILHGIGIVISNSMIAMRKNNVQLAIYLIASLVAFSSSFALVGKWGIIGAAWGYFIPACATMLLLAICFAVAYRRDYCNP